MKSRKSLAGLLHVIALIGAIAAMPAHSQTRAQKAAELAMLPKWCMATQGYAQSAAQVAEYNRLLTLYGQPWSHMHHYCYALLELARQERQFPKPYGKTNASEAIRNMTYVLDRCDNTFTPRAEILAQKARTEMRYVGLEDSAETAEILIKDFPAFPDGYVILAEALLKSGQRDDALKVLNRGSEAVTNKDRFEKLKSLLNLN